jgi:DNA transformation protein
MAVSESYTNYILDQLSEFEGDILAKKMFGGIGIFCDAMMFAMITRDEVFMLKTDQSNVDDFKNAGMQPFVYKGKIGTMPYYTVPENIVEQPSELKIWAEKSFAIAVKKAALKKKKK